jgi:phenylacetate-CoA ligase
MEKSILQLPFSTMSAFLGYRNSQFWPAERLRERKLVALRRLVSHAAKHVPYYRERFPLWGVDPTALTWKEWEKIPPLDKDEVRAHADDLVADNAARFGITNDSTGGSTGSPLHFKLSDAAQAHKIAALLRSFAWAGYRPGTRTLNVQSYYFTDADFHVSPWFRSLRFDSNRLSRESCLRLGEKLRTFRPRIVLGFPFDILTIANFLHEAGMDIPTPRAVITYGETLTDLRRQKIREAWSAPVFNFYSLHEGSALIAECEHGGLHLADDFAHMEITNETRPESGNLLGTNLRNYTMPLLRYRIRDLVEPSDARCPCGRGLRTVRAIHGKACDYLQTPDGRLLGAVMSHSVDHAAGVLLSQCVQETPDRIVVNLVVDASFGPGSQQKLETGLRKRLGPEIALEFRIVPQLRKSPSGKAPFIISEIGNRFE